MRVPVSVLRNLAAGGAAMALSMGCSKGEAVNKDPAPSATVATTDGDTAGKADPRAADGRADDTGGDRRVDDRPGSARATDRDDREVPRDAWFLTPPGQPRENQPASVQPIEPPKPVVAQAPPKPVVQRPPPAPTPHWSVRAACGRG